MKYSIATFCYGERYYEQANRLINSFDFLDIKPNIFIVTDKPESIIDKNFVFKKNISEYNSKYLNYNKNYYSFDFSVKRYSLLYALENGYRNVILVDADVVCNQSYYNHDKIINSFVENSIAGQVTYNFNDEIKSSSQLGKRFLYYEKKHDMQFDKNLLSFMPEDCIQFISIEKKLINKFMNLWGDCVNIKYNENLLNIPAGNIDEMSFSALMCGMKLVNNSDKSINLLIAKHDKWY